MTYSPNPLYGLAHTKEYKPTIVSSFCIDKDDKGNCIQRHSDVYLLLRDKKLQQSIGLETLKEYIERFRTPDMPINNLSDEQLMQLVPIKELYTFTERRQFMEFLESKQKELQDKYKEAHEKGTRYKQYVERFKNLKDG